MATPLPAERVELPSDSPYANSEVFYDENNQAVFMQRNPDLFREQYEITDKEQLHTVVSGDNCMSLANTYYEGVAINPQHYFWYIADLNGIPDYLNLEDLIGTKIIIPDYQRSKLIF